LFYEDGSGELAKIKAVNMAQMSIILEEIPTSVVGNCAVEYQFPLLEPRFRLNTILNTRENAFNVLKKMAEIFRAIPYWAEGAIFLSQEQKADPIMLFTNNSVGSDGFSYSSSPRTARYNSCTVKYIDQDSSFRPRVEYAENRQGIMDNNLIEAEKVTVEHLSHVSRVRILPALVRETTSSPQGGEEE